MEVERRTMEMQREEETKMEQKRGEDGIITEGEEK